MTPTWWRAPEFVRSVPLFALAAVFFVAGAVLRYAYPSYALYGPGVFTFWALLLALGFTCTIGAVVSWTLAGEPVPDDSKEALVGVPPTYLPIEFPEPTREPPVEPLPLARSRAEFGRPAPEVRGASSTGDWFETPDDSEQFLGPEVGAPVRAAYVPEGVEAPAEPLEPVELVLADLERIERDLAPRARPVESTAA
jgi:hypothetical protein